MKVDLFLALLLALSLGMLIGVDKRTEFRYAIDERENKILKELVTVKFVKLVKERSWKEKKREEI